MENQETELTAQEIEAAVETAGNNAPTVDAAAAQAPTYSDEEISRLIEEARAEGYLRGRNEKIEEWLQTTAPESDDFFDSGIADDDSCPGFLAHISPGFWDE